ncbi:MAG: hypothetical protein GXY17_03010 [Clostridiaceae bacterium]|jgi:hypothetical protein|nr:hypothetical protein [Clostridiaceae bacterium]
MKSKKIIKIAALILAGGVLLQTAILAYTGVFDRTDSGDVDISQVIIAEEVQNLIKAQDEDRYEENIRNYKEMIVLLNVHDSYKNEIEDMVKEGKSITDIMIAYTFLNDCYGKAELIEMLVNKKEAGQSWSEIFKQYNKDYPAFMPQSFDFDYLDNLLKQGGITNDDIMIADRVSQSAGAAFEEVIDKKAGGEAWKEINAYYNIVNGQETILRVSVTQEQLEKHKVGGTFSEEQVVETLVTANKLGLDEQTAIDKAKAGYTVERFFAEALEQKYYQ